MADTLGSFLAGINQGVSTGLDLYKTVQSEARQNRLEQYQKQRDAVADQQWQAGYDRQVAQDAESKRQWQAGYDRLVSRDKADDEHWTQNFREKQRELDATIAHQRGMRDIYARNQTLDEQKFRDAQDEAGRKRRLAGAQLVAQNSLLDAEGRYITDPQMLADKLNRDPAAMRAFLTVATETGMLESGRAANYTGGRFVVGPNGKMLLQVAGKDGTGKPIEGTAFLSENGTSDSNDPYVAFDPQTLARMVDPQYNTELRADAVASSEIEKAGQATREYVSQGIRAAGGDAASIQKLSDELGAAETRLAELKKQREALGKPAEGEEPSGMGWWTTPHPRLGGAPGGVPMAQQAEARALDKEIATLSNLLDGKGGLHEQMRAAAEVEPGYMARGDRMYARAVDDIRGQRQTLSGANFLAARGGAPATAAKKQGEVDKAFGDFEKTLLSNITIPKREDPKTGEKVPVVGKLDLQAQLRNLDPETKRVVANDARAQAALMSYVQMMADRGQKSGLKRFVDAASAGVDLERYVDLVSDPAMVDRTDDERHAWAIQSLQNSAPDANNTVSLANGLRAR